MYFIKNVFTGKNMIYIFSIVAALIIVLFISSIGGANDVPDGGTDYSSTASAESSLKQPEESSIEPVATTVAPTTIPSPTEPDSPETTTDPSLSYTVPMSEEPWLV